MRIVRLILKPGMAMMLCCLFSSLSAQNSVVVDSLLTSLSVAKDPNARIDALLGLSAELEGSDQKKALNYAQQAYLFSRHSGNSKGEINALIPKGNCYFRMSEYQHAMECTESSLAMAEELKMDKEIGLSLCK